MNQTNLDRLINGQPAEWHKLNHEQIMALGKAVEKKGDDFSEEVLSPKIDLPPAEPVPDDVAKKVHEFCDKMHAKGWSNRRICREVKRRFKIQLIPE